MGDLIHQAAPPLETTLALRAATSEALVSWNTSARRGRIEMSAIFANGERSAWLPFVTWSEGERRSLGGRDGAFELTLDIARGTVPIVALGIRSDVELDALWVATPVTPAPPTTATAATAAMRAPTHDRIRHGLLGEAIELDVPAHSQYLATHPDQRGWCSPASLAMLLAYWGRTFDVPSVAGAVRDEAYGGTGNWAFNAAFAGSLGFAAATAYLPALASVRAFLAADIPLALSISWTENELPGAPLPASEGHILVVRGFTHDGAVVVNDPAQSQVGAVYPAGAFERAWLGHGGVAYLLAPRERAGELVALATA